jgi:hypothetical protein
LSKEKVKIRKVIANDERLFSLSSVTSPASRNEERRKMNLLSGKKANRKSTYKKKNKENQVEDSPSQPGTGEIDLPVSMEESHQEASEPL